MAEGHDFIMISAGEGYHYLAWAHIVGVAVAPIVSGEDTNLPGRLMARIATVDGQTIEAYDDDARRLDAALRARAGVPDPAAPSPPTFQAPEPYRPGY
jgi:hypothetical protein